LLSNIESCFYVALTFCDLMSYWVFLSQGSSQSITKVSQKWQRIYLLFWLICGRKISQQLNCGGAGRQSILWGIVHCSGLKQQQQVGNIDCWLRFAGSRYSVQECRLCVQRAKSGLDAVGGRMGKFRAIFSAVV
jgi:hypothetical protein